MSPIGPKSVSRPCRLSQVATKPPSRAAEPSNTTRPRVAHAVLLLRGARLSPFSSSPPRARHSTARAPREFLPRAQQLPFRAGPACSRSLFYRPIPCCHMAVCFFRIQLFSAWVRAFLSANPSTPRGRVPAEAESFALLSVFQFCFPKVLLGYYSPN